MGRAEERGEGEESVDEPVEVLVGITYIGVHTIPLTLRKKASTHCPVIIYVETLCTCTYMYSQRDCPTTYVITAVSQCFCRVQ